MKEVTGVYVRSFSTDTDSPAKEAGVQPGDVIVSADGKPNDRVSTLQRIIRAPGHCTFSGQEQVQAFADLVTWVVAGVRPEGDNVLGDLSDAGRKFTNPLRPGDPGGIQAPSSPQ